MTSVDLAVDRHCSVNDLVHIMHKRYAPAATDEMRRSAHRQAGDQEKKSREFASETPTMVSPVFWQ